MLGPRGEESGPWLSLAPVYAGTRIANPQNLPYTLAPGNSFIYLHQNEGAKIFRVLLLIFDGGLILHKMMIGKTFSIPEFLSYVVLNYFLLHIVDLLDST